MLNKIISLFIAVGLVALVIYRSFYYYDKDYGCVIKILPSLQPSNWDAREVLQLIKANDPDKYQYLCKKVDTINKNIGCGGLDGGCFYQNQKNTVYIGNDQDNLAVTAAIVIHELCHLKQYDEGREMLEAECYAEASRFLSGITVY